MLCRLFLLLLAAAVPASAQSPAERALGVEGTEIVVGLSDGRSLRSKDLVGAVLDVRFAGEPVKVRIAAVEADPGDNTGTVWLHTFEARQADGSWKALCTPGPDGRAQGFPLQGPRGLEFACSSGALGKCVRFGFRPWTIGPDGRSLAPAHAACVRMVRGDYGGDGRAWTTEGRQIDVYDVAGIQTPDMDAGQAFEAGWAPEGAVCVHHMRVKEHTNLAELEARYPRLVGRTGPVCTEEFARANGAILFNRSND